ncbi:hypothetical protein M2454_001338 [Aequitasia blattaphilus]|uniref:Lipoprotein n=1 Tax=Aequitasia blattaphilus TaxID=2949332 RepID=A0ABT1E7K7_9FIRM|nr:hypothetical protein [Aequitasia blattaphilus]MCP1101805.1 hypothetical protein [Aequitasia blattaphilus]MCR8614445.1 hypothetical protein [Aequitasia blattaphilus]
MRRGLSLILILSLSALLFSACGRENKRIYSNAKGEMTVEEFGMKDKKEAYKENGFVLKEETFRKGNDLTPRIAKDGSDIVMQLGSDTYPEDESAYGIEEDVMKLKVSFSLSEERKGEVKLFVKDSGETEYVSRHEFDLRGSTNYFEGYVRMNKEYKLPLYYEFTIDEKLVSNGVYTGAIDELGEQPEEETTYEEDN